MRTFCLLATVTSLLLQTIGGAQENQANEDQIFRSSRLYNILVESRQGAGHEQALQKDIEIVDNVPYYQPEYPALPFWYSPQWWPYYQQIYQTPIVFYPQPLYPWQIPPFQAPPSCPCQCQPCECKPQPSPCECPQNQTSTETPPGNDQTTTSVPDTPSTTTTTTTTEATTTLANPGTNTTPYQCTNTFDINFLVDCSGSVEETGFEQEKNFVTTFVSQLVVGPSNSRVAMTLFNHDVHPQWTFENTEQSHINILNLTNNMPFSRGLTEIGKALNSAVELFQHESRQLTSAYCVPRVAILLTDGVSDDDVNKPAAQLRKMGVSVFAVGIGPHVLREQLNAITGNENHVFLIDFNNLQNIISTVVEAVCKQPLTEC